MMRFEVHARQSGAETIVDVRAGGEEPRSYRIPGCSHADYQRFHAELARDLGLREPAGGPEPPQGQAQSWWPLLTEALHAGTLCGYGDPAVLKIDGGWLVAATSNDAPDAFPLLFSPDLRSWEHKGYAFPAGQAPPWTMQGRGAADFWAPEIARVGDAYWLTYTARTARGELALGLGRSADPFGPWQDNGAPLLVDSSGQACGLIDSHLFVDGGDAPILYWKQDSNGVWPPLLARLLRSSPDLAERLFPDERSRRTAAFAAAIEPWASRRPVMERWFLLQPLIGAAVAEWDAVRRALADRPEADSILAAMRTPVLACRLSADGRTLAGQPREVLTNDRDWEGHLIEGPFVTRQSGRYWMFYAGNDFSTADYGVGVAVADDPFGPFEKSAEPLLRSSRDWWGPGHPSVAPGPDGKPQLFFHAFFPGRCGYNEFRSVLTVGLDFSSGEVRLRPLA
jgi:arabinan endo-1,5-alpha-L-arabinosidase